MSLHQQKALGASGHATTAQTDRILKSLNALIARAQSSGLSPSLQATARAHIHKCIAQMGAATALLHLPVLALYCSAVIGNDVSSLVTLLERTPEPLFGSKGSSILASGFE